MRYSYSYDSMDRLIRKSASGRTLLAMAYDGNGNRTLKRQIGGEIRYHFNPCNQLKKVEYPSYSEELFYDRAGNRTRRVLMERKSFISTIQETASRDLRGTGRARTSRMMRREIS